MWNCIIDKNERELSVNSHVLSVAFPYVNTVCFTNIFNALSHIFDSTEFPKMVLLNPDTDESEIFVEEYIRLREVRNATNKSKLFYLNGFSKKPKYNFELLSKPVCITEITTKNVKV